MLVVKPAPTNPVYIDPRLLQEVGDLAEEDCTSSTTKSAVNAEQLML